MTSHFTQPAGLKSGGLFFLKYPRVEIKNMENEYLSRYITLPKLIDMLDLTDQSNPVLKIPFTRLDLQSDPIEGVSNYSELISILKFNDDYIKRVEKDGGIINDKKAVKDYYKNFSNVNIDEILEEIIETRKTSFVSCWVNKKEESLPMWNLYSRKEGAVIKINKKHLVNSLKDSGVRKYDNVVYEKEAKTQDEALFRKNNYYKYEDEFRFVIRSHKGEKIIYKEISIDKKLEFTIVTHPQASDLIKNCYQKIVDHKAITLRESSLVMDFLLLKEFLGKKL